MAEQMASQEARVPFPSRRWIAPASRDPEPAVAKWSRRWRYSLVLGAPLLFWAGLVAAIHWG